MLLNRFLLILLLFMCSCLPSDEKLSNHYPMHDYKTVRLYLDTLNAKLQAQLDSTGTYTIPYTEIKKGKKHLIFFGAVHVRDVNHPQFPHLIKAFNSMVPEIAFNEGGQIPKGKKFTSIDSAILKNGETGVLKLLCDSIGIAMMDGDMDEKEEMLALRKNIPVDQIYLYMAVERYLNGYKRGHYPGITLEEGWRTKFIPYIQRAGLGLTPQQESLDTLKKLYKRYLNKNFNIDSLAEVHEFYLVNEGVLGDVGRATKVVRDVALLSKIEQALKDHDKVFVVFGNSHRIAVEPALKEIMTGEKQ